MVLARDRQRPFQLPCLFYNMFNVLRTNLKAISRRAIHNAKALSQWSEEPLGLSVGRKGGFYPAALGEKLNLTYTIVRKLGWGRHSSVWLAKREWCVIMAFPLD